MPKPKNLSVTNHDETKINNKTLDSSPTPQPTTNQSQPPFKLRTYEALINQIPRFSIDVDMSESTELEIDENFENFEFSSSDEENSTSEEMKILRQSKRLHHRNRDSSNKLSSERLSQDDLNDLLHSPRNRHGGLILKKENAILVNNLKEKMEILKNLIKHESDYLLNLDLLREKFIGTLKRSDLISAEEMEKLFCFSQLNIIWNVNTELLNQFNTFYITLEHINDQSTVVSPRASSIGQIFLRLTPFLKNYIQYSNQLDTCLIAINNKRLKDSYFKSIVKKLEKMCTKLANAQQLDGTFTFLQAMKIPLQQFVYYKKALLDLLNISQSSTEECNLLNESLKLIEIVSQTFDQLLKEMKNREKFNEINKKILKQSETGEVVTIIKPNRVFIDEAEVYMVSSENNYLEIRKKKKKKKDNNSNAISSTQLETPNENFFKDEKNKLVLFHFNDAIVVCTSSFEAPKPSRNSNRETAAKRKRLKQVNSMIEAKKLRFKESIDLESDPVPWIRNIVSNDSPTISTYDKSGMENVTKFTTDLSHMFQLVTWNRIYTFKFANENMKTQWMQTIQQSLTEIKVSRKQDLDYPQAKSGGYLEIPQSWLLPSILSIQSSIRSYFVIQKTLRIKKKSRKGNRARASVIHRINQLDNKLLQNQTFTQKYPKKEAIYLLKDYEEDVNDTYIVVDDEEEDESKLKVDETKKVQDEKDTPTMEDQQELVEENSSISTPVLTEIARKELQEITVDIPQSIPLETTLETVQQEANQEEKTFSAITPEIKKEMIDEIIYEDENGTQFSVRVGDEIVYVDENGNQVIEIVTPEKFLEIVNAADMIEEEEEIANQTRLTESKSVIVESKGIETSEITKNVEEIVEIVEETHLEEIEQTIIENETPVATISITESGDIEAESSTATLHEEESQSVSISQPTIEPNIELIVKPSLISETNLLETTETPQEAQSLPQSSDSEIVTTTPQHSQSLPESATPLEKLPTTTSTQSKPIIPSLDILRKSSDSTSSDQQSTSNLTTPRRSVAALDSPRKKEEYIAPWQKELLNKYKNDGKFKFVTQTAEEKIARVSISEEMNESSGVEEETNMVLQTPNPKGLLDTLDRKDLNRQSIRISSDFQNFLKKFKTIEEKANEEK